MGKLNLFQTPEHECPYLPERMAITQFIDPEKTPDIETYSYLTSFGFRRSGEHIYRPSCIKCSECKSVRLPVVDISMTKSQRRIINKAKHLSIHHTQAVDKDEHYLLYESYINNRHKDGDMYPPTRKLFRNFLLSSWANTQFLEIRDGSKLIACAVYDRLIDGLSAVYCFFDTNYSQYSLGKLAILYQIEFAASNALEHLYLGYQIDNCDKMNYKNKYRPVEEYIDMQWIRSDSPMKTPKIE